MGYVQYIAALLIAGAVAWLLANIGQRRKGPLEWLSDGFASLVSGWKNDAWPSGVQEEDPDRPWGRPARRRRAEPAEAAPPAPVLTPLRPEIRHR